MKRRLPQPDRTESTVQRERIRAMSDEELFVHVGDSDATAAAAAFSELYARHSPRILAYTRVVFPDRAQADDVFQETFTRLYESARKRIEVRHVAAYVLIIARNQCLNAKRITRQNVPLDETQVLRHEDNGDRKEMLELVTNALGMLDEEYREPFFLREFEDLPYDDIAGMLGTTPGNVRVRVSRARQKIRDLLKPYLADYAAVEHGGGR